MVKKKAFVPALFASILLLISACSGSSNTTTNMTSPAPITSQVVETSPPTTQSLAGTTSDPLKMGAGEASIMTYVNPYSGTTWEVGLIGLAKISKLFDQGEEQCYVVAGVLKPTKAPGATAAGFDAPDIGIVSNGKVLSSISGPSFMCDADGLKEIGFGDIHYANVMVGSTYTFFQMFALLPAEIKGISLVGVGTSFTATGGTDAKFYEPKVLTGDPDSSTVLF